MARVIAEPAAPEVDALREYLEAVGKEPLLTAEQEVELAMAIERCHEAWARLEDRTQTLSGKERRSLTSALRIGRRARERFIAANLRLVVSIAKRYQNQGLPLLDLIQEGNIGLMRAVEKFDWRKGFKFSTYATWWIRQAIQRGLGNTARTIRFPVHVEERVRKLRRKQAEFTQQRGRAPTDDELSEMMALPTEEIALMQRVVRELRTVSLHQPVGESGDTELQDLIEDVSLDAPFDEVSESMLRDDLTEAIQGQLDERESRVLALRFGLQDGQPRSLQQVGDAMSLSRERVRQIERIALQKLREQAKLSA